MITRTVTAGGAIMQMKTNNLDPAVASTPMKLSLTRQCAFFRTGPRTGDNEISL
jgi:hypothetical protein